jgi:small-conductance mechanosensitive channel
MSSVVIRQALVPMLGGWLILMAVLAIGLRLSWRAARDPRPAPHRGPAGSSRGGRGWPALLRHGLATAVGGYVLLAAVVVGYYYLIARVGGDFIDSAFSGTAVLIAIAIPVFAVLSWLTEHRRARRDRRDRPGQR